MMENTSAAIATDPNFSAALPAPISTMTAIMYVSLFLGIRWPYQFYMLYQSLSILLDKSTQIRYK